MNNTFERGFSMGAFDALRTYRAQAKAAPGLAPEAIVNLARAVVADATGLDFATAIEIDVLVPACAPHEPAHEFYRHCIFSLIVSQRVDWARVITLGRRRFYSTLSRDEQACFRAARLMEEPPQPEVVEWWDRLDIDMRAVGDAVKKQRSREAERLTMAHETTELANLGIPLQPQWVAMEDNTVGYDVLSYRHSPFGPVNRLIEVKSTIASPIRFYVTRNEWSQAVKFGDAYFFYVWDLARASPELHIRTTAQLEPHIPLDQLRGKWTIAEIPLGGR